MDNVTAVSYIQNMGGTHSLRCNKLAKSIWKWCIDKNIWLSATHIPGISNVEADKASRKFDDRTECMLDSCVFQRICDIWGKPNIDMFASRINFQLEPYVAWKADPGAVAVNAFTLNWSNNLMWIFPPFSLLTKVLQKLREDGGEAIVIAPVWKTQPWWPRLGQMLVHQPLLLPHRRDLLRLSSDHTGCIPSGPSCK